MLNTWFERAPKCNHQNTAESSQQMVRSPDLYGTITYLHTLPSTTKIIVAFWTEHDPCDKKEQT
jgi:hypothetical protein